MRKKKTHSNETMKPHFKFIYTRKLFLNCKLLTMSSLQIIKTLTETIFHSKQSLALSVYIKSYRQNQIMIPPPSKYLMKSIQKNSLEFFVSQK